jgi:predicted nucleic acid-binding Zn ribbon protein
MNLSRTGQPIAERKGIQRMNCLVCGTANPEDVHLCVEDENLRAMMSDDRQE